MKSLFKYRKNLAAFSVLGLFSIGLFYCFGGGYIVVKAAVAQALLSSSWQQTLDMGTSSGEEKIRPWPWADTYPVAKLTIPSLEERLIVLYGTSGRILAFGPGLQSGTALPNRRGNTVIAAHRDTHFSVLKQIKLNDEFVLQDASGQEISYRVVVVKVIEADEVQWIAPEDEMMITLITCYPFEGITEQAKQRYVVRAVAV